MKFAFFFFVAIFLTTVACNSQVSDERSSYASFASNGNGNDRVVVHTVNDPKTGQPAYQIPLPSTWKVNASQGLITGPNGLEIRQYQGVTYTYTNDPYMQQAYAAAGNRMMAPIRAQGVLQQDLQARAGQMGLTFEKAYALPNLAQKDKEYSDQLVSYGNPQKYFEVLGTEWRHRDGQKVLILIHYFEQASMGLTVWGYHLKAMGVDPADFESCKSSYLYALENIRHNRASIDAYNQREGMALRQRDGAFQERMRSNQESFDATQRSYRESQEAINNAQMGIYRSQSESFDRGNQQIMNGIRKENTMYNPTNGENYQVEGYYDNYWMNSDGEYIGTDDQFYDPNMDPNLNNIEWQQGQDPY